MILTPVTLWKDFDETLPFDEVTLLETAEDGMLVREFRFSGRRTKEGRVSIFARYTRPEGKEKFPAVLTLYEVGESSDPEFVRRLVSHGYGVLSVDYCGENGTDKHTVYPADIDYANFVRAGRHIDYAEPTAKETSWYEWAAVARYAARWLSEQPEVTKVGAVGLRTGGEVLFKIAPYAKLGCLISVCAAGWLGYREIEKLPEDQRVLDEERHRFLAGVDSQSYAPHVKCPVLLLAAVNDRRYDSERFYDTLLRVNPDVERAVLYSAHGNGLLGSHSLDNLFLFLDKYLKERSVFVSKPIDIKLGADEKGYLVARCSFDSTGEIKDYGIFYNEEGTLSSHEWTRVLGRMENLKDSVGTVPVSLYEGTRRAFVYAFVHYSNGFSVTSQIRSITVEKQYANMRPRSRILYNNLSGTEGFVSFRHRTRSVAGCFASEAGSKVRLEAGYGGIQGVTSETGLVSYRVGDPGYLPPEIASLCFDVYAEKKFRIRVTFYCDEEESIGYTETVEVEGGGKWKSLIFDPADFKSETGMPLRDFRDVKSVVFQGEEKFLLNNVIWI